MTQRRLFGKILIVMLAVIMVGGVGVAVFNSQEGVIGGLSAGGASAATTTEGYGYGVPAQAVAGGTVPQTVVLGGQTVGTETSTVTETSMSSTTAVGQAGGSQSSLSATSTGGSGHDVELFSSIAIDVAEPSSSLQQVSVVAAGLGGYVAATSYDSTQNGTASMTLMIPAQNFQSAIVQVEALGKVVRLQSSSNDVTVQYQDLNATLSSLLTEQGSLLKLLNQSNSVNSTIQIESILQQTDAQINTVESQILQTAQLVDYATISVTLETATKALAAAPLVMKVSATPRTGLSPLSVTFDALVTGGAGPYLVNYNFGDGTSSEGQQLIHQFVQAGMYNVTVSATDQAGNVTLDSVLVKVSPPQATSGLATFAGSVWALFSGVVEGIIEVAVVVIPIGLVAYAAAVPAWRRYSKTKEQSDDKSESKRT